MMLDLRIDAFLSHVGLHYRRLPSLSYVTMLDYSLDALPYVST